MMINPKGTFALFFSLLVLVPLSWLRGELASLVPEIDWISDRDTKYTLAEIYQSHKATRAKALEYYHELFEKEPNNSHFLVGMAKIYADNAYFSKAIALSQRIMADESDYPLQIKIARLDVSLGYAEKAQNRFERILKSNSSDEVKLAYAHAMMSWGDFYRSERIYQEYLASHPNNIDIELQLIDSWVGQQRFDEAEARTKDLLAHHTKSYGKVIVKIITIQLLRKHFCEALANIIEALTINPGNNRLIALKAEALFGFKSYEEALSCYEQLIDDPEYMAFANIGAGRCCLEIGWIEEAEHYFKNALNEQETKIAARFYLSDQTEVVQENYVQKLFHEDPPAQELQKWAELYAQQGFLGPVITITSEAVCKDPDYFPAQVFLAESLAANFEYYSSIPIYDELLVLFPENAKLHLGRARVISWAKEYQNSLDRYDEMIALNSNDPIPRWEKARVAYWAKWFNLSMCLYQELLVLLSREGTFAQAILTEEVSLEMEAFCFRWNKWEFHAKENFRKLLCLNPENDFWQFEYAQAACTLGQCKEACCQYEEILERSPMHTLAALALGRCEEMEYIGIGFINNFWEEHGRGQLSEIERYDGRIALIVPLSCEQRLFFAQRFWAEHTDFDDRTHPALGQMVGWENSFNGFAFAKAEFTRKDYTQEFDSTYTGLAMIELRLGDFGTAAVSYSNLDIIQNYFNLVQKTQSQNWLAALNAHINHSLDTRSLAEYVRYNDHNSQVHALVEALYAFTESPRIFKVSALAEYRNTVYQDVSIFSPDGTLIDIIHPYWTPQSYWLGQIQCEWRYDYRDFEFCGAPHRFYDIKFSFGTDTESNPFTRLEVEWKHEFFTHWAIGVSGLVHNSPQWKAAGLWCNINYKF